MSIRASFFFFSFPARRARTSIFRSFFCFLFPAAKKDVAKTLVGMTGGAVGQSTLDAVTRMVQEGNITAKVLKGEKNK